MNLLRKLRLLKAFFASVRNPERTDVLLNLVGDEKFVNEETFQPVFEAIQQHASSKAVLNDKFLEPWNVDDLNRLAPGTLGHCYANHMIQNNLQIDFYPKIAGELDIAYIRARVRRCHDIWHVLTGFDTSVEGEAGLQAFTFAQMRGLASPLIISILILHCVFFRPKVLVSLFNNVALGWALGLRSKPLFGERVENKWNLDLNSYRKTLGLITENSASGL